MIDFNDPALMQQLSELGYIPDEQAIFAQQMKMAQALRGTPDAQGTHAGGTYVAASPLEHIANVLTRVKGQRGIDAATQGQWDTIGRGRAASQALAEAFARAQAMRGSAPQPPAPQPASVVGIDPRFT